jgi:hypothetical protein
MRPQASSLPMSPDLDISSSASSSPPYSRQSPTSTPGLGVALEALLCSSDSEDSSQHSDGEAEAKQYDVQEEEEELERLRLRCDSLENSLLVAGKGLDDAAEGLQEGLGRAHAAEAKTRALQAENETLLGESQALWNENETLRNENEILQNENQTLRKEAADVSMAKNQLQGEVFRLEKALQMSQEGGEHEAEVLLNTWSCHSHDMKHTVIKARLLPSFFFLRGRRGNRKCGEREREGGAETAVALGV